MDEMTQCQVYTGDIYIVPELVQVTPRRSVQFCLILMKRFRIIKPVSSLVYSEDVTRLCVFLMCSG